MKELLIKLNACEDALYWAGNKTWEEIYKTCHRGDWLLWLFKKTNPDSLRELTLAKGYCAKTVIHLMNDERNVNAVKVAIKFGEGKATKDELDAAAKAASAAKPASAASACNYAAISAASAAAAFFAATAASAAASASAASAFFAAYAKKENQQLTADICRKYLPFEIWNIN